MPKKKKMYKKKKEKKGKKQISNGLHLQSFVVTDCFVCKHCSPVTSPHFTGADTRGSLFP